MSTGLEWTLGCCMHMPHRGFGKKAHGPVLWSSSRPQWEKMKAQTTGVQQGKGFTYIPQPETKYKEVSDKLKKSQIKIKKAFLSTPRKPTVLFLNARLHPGISANGQLAKPIQQKK